MPNVLKIPILTQSPALVWPGRPGQAPGVNTLLLMNTDPTNTVYIGQTASITAAGDNTIPLSPNGSISVDPNSSWYVIGSVAGTQPLVMVPNGQNYFLPASLSGLGGAKVFVQSATPTGTIPVNSLWFNTGTGALEVWTGTAWDVQQFNAQQLIQADTILAAQIANGTLTAAQLAAAAGILGTQIAAATITSGNIAANTIVAANIAANTITAAQINAASIIANIINGATITGNTINGAIFNGTDWIENAQGSFYYSGTPALGNLTGSIAPAAGTDAFGNTYPAGFMVVNSAGQGVILSANQLIFAGSNKYAGGSASFLFSPPTTTTSGQSELDIAGPTDNTFQAILALMGESNDGTLPPFLSLFRLNTVTNDVSGGVPFAFNAMAAIPANVGMPLLYANANGTLSGQTQQDLNGSLPLVQTDTGTYVNADNGTQPLTATWTIPANDAQVGTVYEIESNFNGTQETATLGLKPALNGVSVTTSNGDVLTGSLLTGFTGWVKLRIVVNAIGSGGNVDLYITGSAGNNANRTASNQFSLSSQATAIAINTTVANTFRVNSVWGSAVASETITGRGNTFTRKGP